MPSIPTTQECRLTIVELARRQHGYMTRGQLLIGGMTDNQVQARVRSRSLIPVHEGVYSLAPWQTGRYGRLIAAVMAAGPDAVLSHQSAAALHGLMRYGRKIHVLKHRGKSRPLPSGSGYPETGPPVIVHRTRRLARREIEIVARIPVTGFVRTTIDLAGCLNRRQMDDYLAEADRLRLLRLGELDAELGSWSGKRGVARLRSILRDWHPATDDEMSRFEQWFVAAIVGAGAPRPQVNPLLDEKLVDCLWPEFKVMFELDGCTYHADPATQIRDARRDVKHTLMGYQVNRFTWPEYRDNPDDVIQRALSLLRLRAWTG